VTAEPRYYFKTSLAGQWMAKAEAEKADAAAKKAAEEEAKVSAEAEAAAVAKKAADEEAKAKAEKAAAAAKKAATKRPK
jgi:hypothetical protein